MKHVPCMIIYIILIYAPLVSADERENSITVVSHYSAYLKREQKMLVYTPRTPEKHSVLYLLHGATGDYTNWNSKTPIAALAADYNLIIVMPDGGPFSWYSDSPLITDSQYESYFMKELIPFIDSVYKTFSEKRGRGICGLSMGGYGALKLGLKYPEYFQSASSLSGVLAIMEHPRQWQMRSIFGRMEDSLDTWKKNDLESFLPLSSDTLAIKFDVGIDDSILKDNRYFAALLQRFKYPFEYAEYPGGHSWRYWGLHILEHLQFHRKNLRP